MAGIGIDDQLAAGPDREQIAAGLLAQLSLPDGLAGELLRHRDREDLESFRDEQHAAAAQQVEDGIGAHRGE